LADETNASAVTNAENNWKAKYKGVSLSYQEKVRVAVNTELSKDKYNAKKTAKPESPADHLIELKEALSGTIGELTIVNEDGKLLQEDGSIAEKGAAHFSAETFEEKGQSTASSAQDLRVPTGEYNLTWWNYGSNERHRGRLKIYNDKVSQIRSILIHDAVGDNLNKHGYTDGCVLIGTQSDHALLTTLEKIVNEKGITNKFFSDKKGKRKDGDIFNIRLIISGLEDPPESTQTKTDGVLNKNVDPNQTINPKG
jgi:hypothetical protein